MAVWNLAQTLFTLASLLLTLGPLFVLGARARRGNAPAVAALLRARKGLSRAAVPLFLLGIAAGGVAQRLTGPGEFVPWLAATSVRIAVFGAWTGLVTAPWLKRLERALIAPARADAESLGALLRSRRPHIAAWGALALVIAIHAAMLLRA